MGLIRLLLAISVVAAHSKSILGCKFVGGIAAVESFFIISGFYMALILNEKYVDKNYTYKTFIKSRIMRLFPVYWAVFLFVLLLHGFGFINNIIYLFKNYNITTGLFMLFSNLFIIGQDAVMFLTINHNGFLQFTSEFSKSPILLFTFLAITPAWSLSLELLFYMLAPFICRFKYRYLIMVFMLSFSIKLVLNMFSFNFDPWTSRFFPAELCFFVAGVFAYKIYQYIKDKEYNKNIGIAFYVTILLFIVIYTRVVEWTPAFQYFYYIAIILAIPFIFNLTKNNKFDNFIANLSYPIYIVHTTILGLGIFRKTIPFYNELNLVFIIFISILLYVYIDKPVNKYRQKMINSSNSNSNSNIVMEVRELKEGII